MPLQLGPARIINSAEFENEDDDKKKKDDENKKRDDDKRIACASKLCFAEAEANASSDDDDERLQCHKRALLDVMSSDALFQRETTEAEAEAEVADDLQRHSHARLETVSADTGLRWLSASANR